MSVIDGKWLIAKFLIRRPQIGVFAYCTNKGSVFVCRIMAAEPVNVNEFQELARQSLPKMYYDFFAGGADDQFTLKENEEAFHRIM